MFRQEFEGGAIGFRVGLHEIAHGLHEEALPFDVSGVSGAFALEMVRVGAARNYEYLCQENLTNMIADVNFQLWAEFQ